VPAPTIRIVRVSRGASFCAANRLSPAVFHFVTRWKSRIASSVPSRSENRLTPPLIEAAPRAALPGNTVADFTRTPIPSIQAARLRSVSPPR
jgi:hypothetical protein